MQWLCGLVCLRRFYLHPQDLPLPVDHFRIALMPRSLLAEFERVDRRFQTSHVRSRTNRSSDNAKSSWYFTLTSGDGSPSPEVEIAKQDVHSEYLDYETGQCISYEILGAHNSTKLTWDDSGTFTLPARSPHFLLGQHINAKPNDHPETPSSEEYVEKLLSGLSPMRYEHSSLASYRLSTVADPLGTLQSAECSPISPISNYGIPFPGDKSDSIDEEMNTPVPPTPRRPSSGARRRNSDHPAVRQYRQPHNQTHLLSKFFKSTTPGSLPFSHHPAPSTFRPSAGDHQNVYDLESSVSRTSSYSPDSQGSSAVSYPRDRFEFLCHSPNNEDLKREHVHYMMQPRLPFRGATEQLEESLYREREQRRTDAFWPSGGLLGSSGNSSEGSGWHVGMDFAVRFVPPRLLRLEFGISEWANTFFQEIAGWMLTAVPSESDPFPDLAYHLSESKETRYTGVLMLTRYLSKVGIFDLTRLRPSKQNAAGESTKRTNKPHGRKKNQHVKKQLIWEIAVACLSLASKVYICSSQYPDQQYP
ncbi:hypothetical protein DL93DRAFT_202020 [Clavulina sp. PMI_390]|nr:hypothetical protein DL93DRAFT_202020 [Clavulina sp. PMI_390]